MTVLFWTLVALLGAVVLALLLPWHVRIEGHTTPRAARVELRLLGGLAPAIPIPLGRGGKDVRKDRRNRRRSRRRRGRGAPRGIPALIRGILSAFRVRRLEVTGRIGLADPADTGQLWAAVAPVAFALAGPRRKIDIRPDFAGPRFDIDGRGEGTIRPLGLLTAGARFAWTNMIAGRETA